MKVKELMQDDYVMVGDKVCRVIEIHAKSVMLRDEEGNVFERQEKHIKPIPLTEDMLLKNGFFDPGYIEAGIQYFAYKRWEYILIHRDDFLEDRFIFEFNDLNSYARIKKLKIMFFHELQHIFKICKIDKRFKL